MENQTIKKPIVSIIIPTFNRAHLLSRAVNSILSQTMQDWELIIIDDGSTDGTEKLVRSFSEKDQRINFIKLDKNSGADIARNNGLRVAKGEYIAFLDADDEWLPKKLEKQLEVFNIGDKNLGLVYTGATFINEKTGELRIKRVRIKGNIFMKELAYNPIGGTSRVMIRKECLDKCGYFSEDFFCLEDWDLWVRITKLYKVDCVDLPLVNYYESEDSISINANNLITGYKKFWLKNDIFSQKKWIQAMHFLRLGHRLLYYGNIKLGRKYLLKAVAIDPFNFRNFLFPLSFFGSKIYRKITFIIMKIYYGFKI